MENLKFIPWNKGKLVGQKAPLKPQEVRAIRIRLELAGKKRDLALFNLAIDTKLRGCDLLSLKVSDIRTGDEYQSRAEIIQSKTGKAVQFEISKHTRVALTHWCMAAELQAYDWLFPSRLDRSPHLSTRQYSRLVEHWIRSIDLPRSLLLNALPSTHQSNLDISEDRQPQSSSIAARAFKDRQHCPVSRC